MNVLSNVVLGLSVFRPISRTVPLIKVNRRHATGYVPVMRFAKWRRDEVPGLAKREQSPPQASEITVTQS